jgi:hypothetical protein
MPFAGPIAQESIYRFVIYYCSDMMIVKNNTPHSKQKWRSASVSFSRILVMITSIIQAPKYNLLQAVISEILVFVGYIVNDNSRLK